MRLLICAVLLATCCPVFAGEPANYAKPELLVEPDTLKAYFDGERDLFESGVTLIDVRSMEDHTAGNLMPGYRIDISEWKSAFGDGTDTQGWTTRIGAVVHEPKKTIIVYDVAVTPSAARAWWLLKYWGADDVKILNGGFKASQAAGLKVYPFGVRLSIPSKFVALPQPSRLATYEKVLQTTACDSNAGACLIDTRTNREVGAGVIPTASHSDWTNYVDPPTGKMRSAAELKLLLDAAGFAPEQQAISYCRSGGRASVVAFAMELMGGERVANYWGSWSEWSKLSNMPEALPSVPPVTSDAP